jgi:hypothetical protein
MDQRRSCAAIFIHQCLGCAVRQHGIAEDSAAARGEIRSLHWYGWRGPVAGSLRRHQPRHLMPAVHDHHRFTTLHQGQPRWQTLAELLKRRGAHGRKIPGIGIGIGIGGKNQVRAEAGASVRQSSPTTRRRSNSQDGLNPLEFSDLSQILLHNACHEWHLFWKFDALSGSEKHR